MKFRTALIIAVITAMSSLLLIPKYVQWKNSVPANRPASSPDLSGENAIRQLKENGEFESLGAAITAARYEADSSDTSASAENHANKLRATFSPEGLVLRSSNPDATWESRWRLQNLDRGDQRMTVGSSEVETEGQRITINRRMTGEGESQSAIVEEWFNNTPGGLEHGFTLPERLTESEKNLRLTIAVDGDLEPQADADGQNLQLVNKQGEAVLNYEKLRVWDADGAEIAARMTAESGIVMLEVEDAGAKYPLVIDPTFTASAKLIASGGSAGDWFGKSVAISGDTVVVGVPRDHIVANAAQGSAFVFVRGVNGLWTQQAKLSAVDGGAGDEFGSSVSISGDSVTVGAPYDDIGSNPDQGSVYTYQRTGTLWVAGAKLFAADNLANDRFGSSLAMSADAVIIGVPGHDPAGETAQGSAYLFERISGTWTIRKKFVAPDGASYDLFGSDVDLSGGTAVIGAPGDRVGENVQQGSAYVYTGSGTTWSFQQKMTAADGQEMDSFGSSVGVSINLISGSATVVVGAPRADPDGVTQRGSAYIFVRAGTTWTFQQKLTAAGGLVQDNLGFSVDITGGTVILGARSVIEGVPPASQGKAYIFSRSGTTWHQQAKLTAYDGGLGDGFGFSVAIAGDTAVVGAYRATVGVNLQEGAAHVFRFSAKPFDFDDDGRTDIGIFRPTGSQWWINRSSTAETFALQFGQASDKIVPADYTGDGKTDIAIFRPANGNWYILRSEDSSFYAFPFGTSGDIPAPADYDGDRIADAAVFRPSTSIWYIAKSTGGTSILQFGLAGDVPVVGDYDGDRRADVAIFRPNSAGGAQWWISKSSTGQVAALQFGNFADNAAPSDYTGDGKTDIAFWRPTSGNWFVLRSEDLSFYAFPFGTNGDVPAPGDYDGDGKSDAAIFRPSNSHWYISKSSGGTLIQQFGLPGDVPVASAFIP